MPPHTGTASTPHPIALLGIQSMIHITLPQEAHTTADMPLHTIAATTLHTEVTPHTWMLLDMLPQCQALLTPPHPRPKLLLSPQARERSPLMITPQPSAPPLPTPPQLDLTCMMITTIQDHHITDHMIDHIIAHITPALTPDHMSPLTPEA